MIQQQILAPLRNKKFYSLSELNAEISPLLKSFNNKVMKSYGFSRYELYQEVELAELSPLPIVPYQQSVWKKAKVTPDYHVLVEKCFYSVPCHYRGITVDVCINEKTVEFYQEAQQIALHKRVRPDLIKDLNTRLQSHYSTNEEHMPGTHQFVTKWSKQELEKFAVGIGTAMIGFIDSFLRSQEQELVAVKTASILPSLKTKYGKELMEMTATMLSKKQVYSIKHFRETLILLVTSKPDSTNLQIKPIEEHANIRGGDYYH